MKKLFIFALCLSFAITGCSSTSGNFFSSSSVDEELTHGDSAEFFSKSGWQACAVGAVAGGGGCLLLGGSKVKCLIMAATGCGVAMGGNYYLDAKRAEYANEEDRLDSYIADVKKDTEEVKAVSDNAKHVLNKNKATLSKINSRINQNKLDKDSAEKELAQIDANLVYLNDKLEKMKKTEQNWRSVSEQEAESGMKVAKLDKQITQLNKQISVLEKQITLVSQQRSAVRVA